MEKCFTTPARSKLHDSHTTRELSQNTRQNKTIKTETRFLNKSFFQFPKKNSLSLIPVYFQLFKSRCHFIIQFPLTVF